MELHKGNQSVPRTVPMDGDLLPPTVRSPAKSKKFPGTSMSEGLSYWNGLLVWTKAEALKLWGQGCFKVAETPSRTSKSTDPWVCDLNAQQFITQCYEFTRNCSAFKLTVQAQVLLPPQHNPLTAPWSSTGLVSSSLL